MTKKEENKKKAQVALMGLLFAFMLIATFAILARPLLEFVDLGVNATQNATNGDLMVTILQILPVFLVLVILIASVALITGRTT